MKITFLFTYLIMVISFPLLGQNNLLPATECFYLKDAHVVTKPGADAFLGSVIIRNGIIEAVGSDIAIPWDAKIIEMDSMYLYPGFIAAISHVGLKDEDNKKKEDKPESPGQATFEQAGITPQNDVIRSFDFNSKSIAGMRKAGFGICHTVPKGYIIPGQGAIVSLKEGSGNDDLILDKNHSMYMSLSTKRGVFPSTLIGAMSRLREIHKNTGLYQKNIELYHSNPNGIERPVSSTVYDAMHGVYNKEQPVYFKAEQPKEIHRALSMNNEFGYRMILSNIKLVSPIIELLPSDSPVLLSLDLPKEIIEERDDEKDKKRDENELTPEQKRLMERKKESYNSYMTQAKILDDRGIEFSFAYTDIKSGDILSSVRRLVKAGLKEESALKALTTQPAQMLGISAMAGTVEKGKLGNLVVFDKPMFYEKSAIRYVLVEGQITEMEKKKKSENKKSSGELGNITGAWRFTVDVPEDEQVGNLFFEPDGDSYKVRLEADEDPGEFEDGKNVEIKGNFMTFDMTIDNDGYPMNVSFDIKFEGDFLEGTVTVEEVGSFPIEAVKRAIPD